jgi:tetratricopeptide (TPR) repeat protein
MTYSDYVHIPGSGAFRDLNEVLARREINLLHRIMRGPAAVAGLLSAPVAASRDAAPARGRFPLVGYTPGLNEYLQHGNFVLGEYLASHGYVVVSVPQVGTTSLRLEFGIDPVSLETQMRDIEFALALAGRLPVADPARVALIGHSMGGVSSVLGAMRDSRVDAVVGLDSSYGARALISTLTASPFYSPRRMRVPWLDLRRAANDELDSTALEALSFSDRYQILFRGVAHADFTSFPMIAANFPTDIAGRTPEHASRVYETVVRTIRAFLDSSFREPLEIAAALRAALAADTAGALVERFTHLDRQDAPLSSEELAFLIARDGLDAALARHPAASSKAVLNGAGYRLVEWQRSEAAIEVFRRNVELHPGDSNLLDSLAEGYLAARRLPEAAATYREVLDALANDAALDAQARESIRRNATAQLLAIEEQIRSSGTRQRR